MTVQGDRPDCQLKDVKGRTKQKKSSKKKGCEVLIQTVIENHGSGMTEEYPLGLGQFNLALTFARSLVCYTIAIGLSSHSIKLASFFFFLLCRLLRDFLGECNELSKCSLQFADYEFCASYKMLMSSHFFPPTSAADQSPHPNPTHTHTHTDSPIGPSNNTQPQVNPLFK